MRNILKIVGKHGSGKTRALRTLAEAYGTTPFVLREVGRYAGLEDQLTAGAAGKTFAIDEVTPYCLSKVEDLAVRYGASYFILSIEG